MADQNPGGPRKGGPKAELFLLIPSTWDTSKNEVPLRVVLFEGTNPRAGTEIVFSLNGKQLGGSVTTNDHGEANFAITYPKDVSEINIRAEAVMPGRPNTQRAVPVPTRTPEPNEVELFIETVKLSPGDFYYYISVVDAKKSRGMQATLTFMVKKPVQYTVIRNGIETTEECKDRPFNEVIPPEGLVVHVRTNEPGLQEIDLIPATYPKAHKEIRVFGPLRQPVHARAKHSPWVRFWDGCTGSHGDYKPRIDPSMSEDEVRLKKEEAREISKVQTLHSRGAFAMFSFAVFACGMGGLFFWKGALVICLVAYMLIIGFVTADLMVDQLNKGVARTFMKTNNRWFAWLFLFWVILLITLVFFTPLGGHQAYETSTRYAQSLAKTVDQEVAERNRNLKTYGRYETDEEMGNVKTPEPTEVVTLAESVPYDPDRQNWFIRFFSFVVLTLLTLSYFFISRWDEAEDQTQTGWSWLKEKSEGDVAKTLVTSTVPIITGAASGDAGNLVSRAANEFAWEAAFETVKKSANQLYNILRRGVRD